MSRRCTPGQVWALAQEEGWSPEARQAALTLASTPPGLMAWQAFLDRVMLGLGTLGLLCGVVLLVASQWGAWGRWGQAAIVSLLLFLSAGASAHWGLRTRTGGWSLVLASGCLGALIGLVAQEFYLDETLCLSSWTLLLLPPSWRAGFAPQWALWLVVANLTLFNLGDSNDFLALIGILNGTWWALSLRFYPRLGWPTLSAWFTLVLVTYVAGANLLERESFSGLLSWLLVAGTAAVYAWPRRRRGTLAGLGFSTTLLITTALIRSLDFGMQSLLVIGCAVVLQIAALLEFVRRLPPAQRLEP